MQCMCYLALSFWLNIATKAGQWQYKVDFKPLKMPTLMWGTRWHVDVEFNCGDASHATTRILAGSGRAFLRM